MNADGLAARVGAGKAGIYRRWADIADVAVAAVNTCILIPPVVDTGSLRGDLLRLLEPLAQPLTRDERATAAPLGQARHDPRIQRALDGAVVGPPAGAMTVLVARHAGQGHPVTPSSQRMVGSLVQALWWGRYLTGQPMTTPSELPLIIDRAQLSMLR